MGQCTARLEGQTKWIRSLVWSPDGRLASADADTSAAPAAVYTGSASQRTIWRFFLVLSVTATGYLAL